MNELRQPSKRYRVSRLAVRLCGDESGNILLYFTIMVPVIFGLIGLALEGAGFFTLNNQLQALADASALAGAKELDRAPGAICRARNAAQNHLSNDPQWSWSVVALGGPQIQEPQFFGPGIDDGPLAYTCANATSPNSNDNLAGYIKVTTVTRQVTPTFVAAVGATANAQTAATATAGNDTVVCDSPPMYICNPFETAGMTYEQATQAFLDAVANATTRGKMISLRRDPGNSSLTPGNYGFLNAPDTNGFSAVRDAIAKVSSPACFKRSTVDFQTGFAGNSIAPAVNVRFDAYDNSMNKNKSDPNYAPATNVRKGYWLASGKNWCQAGPDSNSPPRTMGMPADATTNVQGPLGAGDWDFDMYWSTNHPGVAAPTIAANDPGGLLPIGTWSNGNRPSRYDVYLYEIRQGSNPGGLQDASYPSAAPPQEIGAPRCNTNLPPVGVDRRLMTGAVVNCLALGPLNGSEDNVPAIGFGQFFLIKPVVGSQDEIDAEVVRLIAPGAGGGNTQPKAHQVIQLYR